MNRSLDEVIKCITMSNEYKKCIELKDKMSKNEELINLIEQVKSKQKQYIKSNFDESIKDELKLLEDRLNEIPIYVIYMQNLEIVNEKINLVKDELNRYFFEILNGEFI